MELYIKNFDEWNEKKKLTDSKIIRPPFFKERDIWWVSIGVNIGYEVDGKDKDYVRPVLIIRKFSTNFFLGLPMSTKLKKNKYYFALILQGKNVSVLISQLRSFSSKRICNKLGELEEVDFDNVLTYMKKMILPLSPEGKSRG